jgi:hypothetical protein
MDLVAAPPAWSLKSINAELLVILEEFVKLMVLVLVPLARSLKSIFAEPHVLQLNPVKPMALALVLKAWSLHGKNVLNPAPTIKLFKLMELALVVVTLTK